MGDLNAKVGGDSSGNIVGRFGLGDTNARGDTRVEWCESWEQISINIYFRHHPRHFHKWENPGGRVRNQIDYITFNKRFRNSIRQLKTYPGADYGGGYHHIPVVVEMRVKLKRLKKNNRVRRDWNILRKDEAIQDLYAVQVSKRYTILNAREKEESIEKDWRVLQHALVGHLRI